MGVAGAAKNLPTLSGNLGILKKLSPRDLPFAGDFYSVVSFTFLP